MFFNVNLIVRSTNVSKGERERHALVMKTCILADMDLSDLDENLLFRGRPRFLGGGFGIGS